MTPRRRFWHIAGAGTAFQAGSAAVDSATVMAALDFQLTGSAVAVGAVSTILRLGWLLPQLVVGYLAGRTASAMPFYVVGAFGRTIAIFLLAAVLWSGATAGWSYATLGATTLALWTVYAGLSGVVGVPYNDIVARSVPSDRRSQLLAIRYFGGGLVALGVAAIADRLVRELEFPISYAAIFGIAALLMLVSSVVFTTLGEPKRTVPAKAADSFREYLREGISTVAPIRCSGTLSSRNGAVALSLLPRHSSSSRPNPWERDSRTWHCCLELKPPVRLPRTLYGAGGATSWEN